MILTSTARNSMQLPVAHGRGADVWWKQYALPLGAVLPGSEMTAHGKIQAKNYNLFDIEFRIGLFVSDGLLNPSPGNDDCLHPLTGENVGPSVSDKYKPLMEIWNFVMPDGLADPWLCLRVSMRSTQAVATTRIDFGNGYLQVRA